MHIVIINGPNLNLLGRRQKEIYGDKTLEEVVGDLKAFYPLIKISHFQSNHEGAIIDKLHEVGFTCDGVILNAGGYTHTSIAIADAVSSIATKVVEVHISNIYTREKFRSHSYLTEVCAHSIVGRGTKGYQNAVDFLLGSK